MAEVTTLNLATQLGVEATKGTAVPADKKLLATAIALEPDGNIQTFRPRGSKFKTIAAMGKEWSGGSIEGQPSYSDLAYLLDGLIKKSTPVRNVPTTGTSYTRTYVPSASTEDDVQTFTVEQAHSVRSQRAPYVLINGLELKGDREKVELSGSVVAKRIEDGVTATATPTEIAPVPIMPGQVDVFLDDTSAGLGGTKLLRVFQWGWGYTDRFGMVWPVNSAIQSFDAHIEKEPNATARLVVAADAVGMGLLTAMRAGTTKFLRIQAKGALIETTYSYELKIDAAVKVTKILKFEDQDGVRAVGWDFECFQDAVYGKAFEIKLTSTLATL